jgi:NADPH:quinone reductase
MPDVTAPDYGRGMRAITYTEAGPANVLTLTDRPAREPGPGEVRVRVHRSGVNPTDWKSRAGTTPPEPQVPGQDGSGVIDAVGPGVDATRIGERVWIWEAAYQRSDGTAQELTIVPVHQAVALPASASFDLGAALGIPFLTAHRCLTVHEDGPVELTPGSLAGRTVLVAGGAGAVGNAAIQLARWADATVLTTVSSPAKAQLAAAAGADHIINYRTQDAAAEIRKIVPGGVDSIVEVSAASNADLDLAVTARYASIAAYADDGRPVTLPVRGFMAPNVRWQFVLIYTAPHDAKARAVAAVSAALAAGELRVGPEAGVPLHHYRLEETAAAHDAVAGGATGKVLIDVTD